MDITSQNAAIKSALLKGEIITPIDALNRFGCLRLSARIWDLRNEQGLPIEMILSEGKKRFAQYFMLHTTSPKTPPSPSELSKD